MDEEWGLNTSDLAIAKKYAIKVARELCYSRWVVERIRNAKNREEINIILHTARKGE